MALYMSLLKNLFVVFITILLIQACNSNSSDDDSPVANTLTPTSKVSLRALADCNEATLYFADNLAETLVSNNWYFDDGFEDGGDFITTAIESGSSSGGNPDSVSDTNLQVDGVDEADSVKTDSLGNIYIAHHESLLIYDGFPAEDINQLANLDLDGRISGLYLMEDSNQVIALVQGYRDTEDKPAFQTRDLALSIAPDFWEPGVSIIRVITIDVSDLSEPVLQSDIAIDGYLVSSRLIDNRLHVLSNFQLNRFIGILRDEDIDDELNTLTGFTGERGGEEFIEIRQRLRDLILAKLQSVGIDQFLPANIDHSNGDLLSQLSCDAIHAPEVNLTDASLMTVSSLDAGSSSIQQAALLGSGWITYVTPEDLFFVQNSNNWWWSTSQRSQSAIHHFSIGGDLPEYRSSGSVAGMINNSFSMSYHDNHLRIATSERRWINEDGIETPDTNHLFVLRDNDTQGMDTVGEVTGYADGERIFSARFFNDKAFVVTFRQVDPLFGFDLNDHINPFIVSELKIPGFSTYIHPLTEDLLLTIGQDGDDQGASNDIAIKLFDVSDLSDLQLIDNYVPDADSGYSWSAASWDHHAFNYHAEAEMLAIPYSSFSNDNDSGFSGLLALNIDSESLSISELGRMNHRLLRDNYCDSQDEEFCDHDALYSYWPSQPRRSVIMTEGDQRFLYAISSLGLSAINTSNFNITLGSDIFPRPGEQYYYWY